MARMHTMLQAEVRPLGSEMALRSFSYYIAFASPTQDTLSRDGCHCNLCHLGDSNAPDGGRIPRIPPDTPGYHPRIPQDTTPRSPPIPFLDTPRYHALGAHCGWLGGTDCNADSANPRARGTFRFFCVGFDNRVASRALNWGRLRAFTVQGAGRFKIAIVRTARK